MVTVGVTGGIGSGKSTVCRFWEQMGAYVLNADDLAKQVMVSDPKVREELAGTFGEKTFLSDGSLNRSYLAEEAFGKGRVEELNAIVHPRLPEASRRKMKEAERKGYPVFVYEAALLLENLEPGRLDYLVLVLADEEERVERVRKRDDTTDAGVKERIAQQRDFAEAVDQVDVTIYNNGTLEDLRQEAQKVYSQFLAEE